MTAGAVDAVWGALLAVAVGLQALALRRRRVATLGAALRAVASSRLGTAGLALAWAWFGWHTFAR